MVWIGREIRSDWITFLKSTNSGNDATINRQTPVLDSSPKLRRFFTSAHRAWLETITHSAHMIARMVLCKSK
jgi:hypothetical protein